MTGCITSKGGRGEGWGVREWRRANCKTALSSPAPPLSCPLQPLPARPGRFLRRGRARRGRGGGRGAGWAVGSWEERLNPRGDPPSTQKPLLPPLPVRRVPTDDFFGEYLHGLSTLAAAQHEAGGGWRWLTARTGAHPPCRPAHTERACAGGAGARPGRGCPAPALALPPCSPTSCLPSRLQRRRKPAAQPGPAPRTRARRQPRRSPHAGQH